MQNLNTQNQNPDKIVSVPGYTIGSFTCYNANNDDSANIQLTALEEMWYSHEENIDHPEGSEYPVSINVPHMKVMRERVADSVLNRTGIDIRDFDSVIHASTHPGKDENGNIIDHGNENVLRNIQL
tara:strand:- start:1038 stop:1415 length:378 start_codon:yes stop_codon:yes gene_type:complete